MRRPLDVWPALTAALALGGCGSEAKLSVEDGTGPVPTLPSPEKSLVPTVNIALAMRRGGFYGWPYSYFGRIVDERVEPPRPDLVAQAIKPDYALGPHTASLGLAHSEGAKFPARFGTGMFVGQHGSWNREPLSGYRVISCHSAAANHPGRRLTC